MNMKWKKAWSELKAHPRRSLLVIAALAIGLWGVGSIGVSYSILGQDLDANFQGTQPPHLIVHSKQFNKLYLKEFTVRKDIENAEFRDFSKHRIEIRPGVWVPLHIYGVKDAENMRLALMYHQKGKKRPAPGSIKIERNGQQISDLRIGKVARIRVSNQVLKLPVSGTFFDPGQAPSTQEAFIYSYVSQPTYQKITGRPIDQRLLVRFRGVSSEQEVRKKTQTLIESWKKAGIAATAYQIPNFGAHPHQWQLNAILFLIGGIGLLAFLMGAVLVSQLIQAIISGQIRQIGMLKAIGATRLHIFQMYIFMLLLLGLASGLIGIPLAVASGYGYAYFVAFILNFEVLTTSLGIHVYLSLLGISLLLPVLFSLPALYSGSKTTVREALSDYGIHTRLAVNKTLHQSKWPLPTTFMLAFRNALRNSRRLTVTVAAMALGVAIFSVGFNIRQSLANYLAQSQDALRYDIQVTFDQQVPKDKATAPFRNISSIQKMAIWSGSKATLQPPKPHHPRKVLIVALPYDTDMQKLTIVKGRWLKPSKQLEIVMNQDSWQKYGYPKMGATIAFTTKNKLAQGALVGVIKQFEAPKLYMDKKQYDARFNPKGHVNSLVMTAKNRSFKQVITLKKVLEKAIIASDLKIYNVMSQAETAKALFEHLNIILTTIVFLSLLVLVVSAIGMASATGINIMERTREIGVMRAIGATPKRIYQIFVSEGMMVGSVSIVLGLILSIPFSQTFTSFFGNMIFGRETLDPAFSPVGFGMTLFATLLFSWMASRIPAKRAVALSTREALTYE